MGIFDFVRNAGAKLFGKDKPEMHGEPSKPLRQHVEEHGISAKDINFHFQSGVLIVEGYVPDQVTREKVILIVGNVEGVDKVDDRLRIGTKPPVVVASTPLPDQGAVGASTSVAEKSAAEPGWTSRTYTVKSGDSLSKIAKAMYGDASKYPTIFEANKPMLKDPDKIYPGQVLRIPAV
jgi:nucleoid-associated protein YgaU